jgi:hypothetical protein
MSEEKEAIDYLKNDVVYWLDKGKDFVVIDIGENEKLHSILNLIEKQQKLINIFIHNEAVREDKNFNEIKDKYYEFL